MLPSYLTLDEIHAKQCSLEDAVSGGDGGGPIRVSRGNHPSVRRKDKQRAELYQQGRVQRSARSQYWN
jgi:hypothetical protein